MRSRTSHSCDTALPGGVAGDFDARELAVLAGAEVTDAIQVFGAGALAAANEPSVLSARAHLFAARSLLGVVSGMPARAGINHALDQAAESLRVARASLANPTTVPRSFQT